MNSLERDIKNIDGTIDRLIITSNNNLKVLDSTKTYKLANYANNLESKLTRKFKNSILGSEIGIKANGFSNIAILSTIIAIGVLLVMYILWRI